MSGKLTHKEAQEKGRKGGLAKKGKKHKITLLKEKIGVDRTNLIIEQIEKNIEEFITHKDEKIRLDATKAFTDYYKARKRESNLNIKGNINFVVNKNLVSDNNECKH